MRPSSLPRQTACADAHPTCATTLRYTCTCRKHSTHTNYTNVCNLHLSYLFCSYYYTFSIPPHSIYVAWVVKIIHTKKKTHINVYLPSIMIFIANDVSHFSSLKSLLSWGWCPMLPLLHSWAYQVQFTLILSGWATWQVLSRVNTQGSLMPSCMLKNCMHSITVLVKAFWTG